MPVYFLYQCIQIYRFRKRDSDETPSEFKFRFDEEGSFYQGIDLYLHQKWSSFTYYSLDKRTVYLYSDKKKLKEILAEEIISFTEFNRALDIIQGRLTPMVSG